MTRRGPLSPPVSRRALLQQTAAILAIPASLAPRPGLAAAEGAVFALTNDPSGNAVAVFRRAADGSLSPVDRISTGGRGIANEVASQGALTLSRDLKFLLAVNPGSDEVSVFRLSKDSGLTLTDRVPSGGAFPISVTIDRKLVYVLNAHGNANITGFHIDAHGTLTEVPRSTRTLESTAEPFQVQFTPDGSRLVVTIMGGSLISVYPMHRDGRPGEPVSRRSTGDEPTGFDFAPASNDLILLIAETFAGPPPSGGLSSYRIGGQGVPTISDESVLAFGGFNCWIVVNPAGGSAYSSSPQSNAISAYVVNRDGSLASPGDGVPVSTAPGSKPSDLALNRDGRFLYVLLPGTGGIGAFATQADGSLVHLASDVVLPIGSAGLAAF